MRAWDIFFLTICINLAFWSTGIVFQSGSLYAGINPTKWDWGAWGTTIGVLVIASLSFGALAILYVSSGTVIAGSRITSPSAIGVGILVFLFTIFQIWTRQVLLVLTNPIPGLNWFVDIYIFTSHLIFLYAILQVGSGVPGRVIE